jgi:hypothetical protein
MGDSLVRFWFEFETTASWRAAGRPWVGVTALDAQDAREIVQHAVFGGDPLPPVEKLIEDVDISDLDPKHVLNQMAPPNLRGVWYPRGYEG